MTSWMSTSQRRQDRLTAYLCLTPWLIGFVGFVVGPMLFSLGLSFYEADLLTDTRFVGLANYAALGSDELFWQSLRVTFLYALTTAPLDIALALSIALLLNQKSRGVDLWWTIYQLPTVISGLAVSLLWLQMFNPRAGLNSHGLHLLRLPSPACLYASTWALLALILMSLWGGGANLLLYLAVLYGCSRVGIFFRILLPQIRAALLVVALTQFTYSWNDFFAPLLYLDSPALFTITLGLTRFLGQTQTDLQYLMAMTAVSTLPPILLFFLTQRTFMQGVVITGVKG